MALPARSWTSYLSEIHALGEKRCTDGHPQDGFLASAGLLNGGSALSEKGRRLFDALYIQGDSEAADTVLREALLEYPPAMAILQLLSGSRDPSRSNVEAILRSRGFLSTQPDRCIGSLLMLLNHAKLIRYQKTTGEVRVLWTPADESKTPRTMFISPDTPFGNRAWLRAVLSQCREHIYWLDKHFLTAILDELWNTVTGSHVSSIRILSLRLPDNSTRGPMREYSNFAREMDSRGVNAEWRILGSKDIRDTHDRWIITEDAAWNVPNANAILSGQNSEICESDSRSELAELFLKYWNRAQDVLQ